ncbi:MAG: hypothetical protein CMM95_02090 [Rickettsiales bacterium]|nr:hypothetical protein [Rickettsiales bacterium]|tara:strand:+ start:589 stop:948 length:360 start_codon:yes stop_codon:yes gene_type:complete
MIVFVALLFFSKIALSGEIDGKGVICKIYGNTIGYFFEENRAYEYKLLGGDKELELSKKDIGKYFTNENYIYIDEIKIDRKNLKFQKYSSFRGECEAFKNFELFKKNMNIKALTKDNKI